MSGWRTGVEPINMKVITGALFARRAYSFDQLQVEPFVRYRHGLHGTVVITFDEVIQRLIELQTRLASLAIAAPDAQVESNNQ